MAINAATIVRAAFAFVAGVATGTVLAVLGVEGPVDAITHTARLLAPVLHGGASAAPAGDGSLWRVVIVAEWHMALTYSAIVGVIAAPIWYGLERIGANRVWHALALGLVLGAIAGALVFFKSTDGFSAEFIGRLTEFGLIGAAAGLAEWLVGHPRRAKAAKSSVT